MAITKAEAQDVTLAFTRDYPGALKLLYAYRETIADLYGPQVEGIPESAKGGYFPKETFHNGRVYSGRIDVPLANVSDPGDLLLTLRQTCERCGGQVKVIASIEDPAVIAHILKHLKQKEALQAGLQPHELPLGVWLNNNVLSVVTHAILLNFFPELTPAAWRLNQRP